MDRWMYPFNVTPGSRIQAPTFGALGSEGFDERDGQFILALNTDELGIESQLPPPSYQINSATLVLTETFGGYRYDSSYDPFQTYLDPESANYVEDEDGGRPIELYGVGFRGDFTEFAWPDGVSSEAPAFGAASSFGGQGKRVRSVFSTDADGIDVSNNVDSLNDGVDGFETSPFAIARMIKDDAELEPGAAVTVLTQWMFEIDVADQDVQRYFASSLSKGQLGFAVTSLHTTGVQGMGDPFPNPATTNHFAFAGPTLTLDVEIVDAIRGDYNGDSELTSADIDLLSAAVRNGTSDSAFDLTNDGLLTNADREEWISIAGVLLGDADFSGTVAVSDFLALSRSFGNAGGWAEGDFDGSGNIAVPDFLTLSRNFGQSTSAAAAVTAVPEPSGLMLLASLAVALPLRRRVP